MIALYCLRLRGGDEPDEFEMFQNEDNPGAKKIDVIRYFDV